MNKKVREYDTARKEATLEKLKAGFEELKSASPKKQVTKYALSKHTGVARQTISKYDEIVELLENQTDLECKVKTHDGIKAIKTKKDVRKVLNSASEKIKEQDEKYNELLKENTKLNLKIVQLNEENKRLNGIVERYKRVMENEN